jgi:trehalose 6-phosphate phosphatase
VAGGFDSVGPIPWCIVTHSGALPQFPGHDGSVRSHRSASLAPTAGAVTPLDARRPPRARSDWALFLDVDGTLLDIAETPHAVEVPGGMVDLLRRLHRALGGALALASGRPIETLDRWFHPFRPAAAGLHGLERRGADGVVTRIDAPARTLDQVRERLAGAEGKIPGLLVEDKGRTVAVHYRRAPDREREVLLLVDQAARDLGDELELLAGKKVLEIRPRGAGKGSVVETFMAEPPFRGRTPVFVGDDRTDEDGFAAVNRLGGHSIRVGGEGSSGGRYQLEDAADVRAWLAAVADEIEAGGGGRGGGERPASR